MNIGIDKEFRGICEDILNENKSDEEWALIESCDMFQTEHYCGGYEELENAFCFSYYHDNGNEYWFQVTLDQIKAIQDGSITHLTHLRLRDT